MRACEDQSPNKKLHKSAFVSTSSLFVTFHSASWTPSTPATSVALSLIPWVQQLATAMTSCSATLPIGKFRYLKNCRKRKFNFFKLWHFNSDIWKIVDMDMFNFIFLAFQYSRLKPMYHPVIMHWFLYLYSKKTLDIGKD